MAALAPGELQRLSGARTADLVERLGRVVETDTKEATVQATEKIWMNGELVDWDDARVHVGAHGLHYGTGVFEGIRCYDTPKGPAVFRLTDHMQRLHDSARLIDMEIPYSVDELRARDERPARRERPRASATSARSPSTASASSASRRAATRSRR